MLSTAPAGTGTGTSAVRSVRAIRTGRPYRPPEDRVAPEQPLADRRVRTAWLLGTSRVLCRDGAYGHRREFVAALQAAGIACDESRVSRWESGASLVPTTAVAAYERILGLPTYSLRGAVDLVRPLGGTVHGLVLDDAGPTRLDQLFGLAFAGSASGLDWLELAQRINATGGWVYLREREWSALMLRLLSEQCRSVGTGWAARTAALSELITHPSAQHRVVRAIGHVVVDGLVLRGTQSVQLLRHIGGAPATSLALRLLEGGDTPVRASAAHALAALLADGGFDRAHLGRLAELLVRLLRHDPADEHLLDVALRLPVDALEQVQRAVQSPALDRVAATHELVERTTAASAARELASAANRPHRHADLEPDGMLTRLAREALFHAHARRRQAALGLLSMSPYAEGLADGCAALASHANPVVAHQALRALRWVVRDRHAERLAALASDEARPLGQRSTALSVLGNLPSRPEGLALRLLREAVADERPALSGPAADTLGVHGLLAQVAGDRALPRRAAGHAGWWQRNGARLSA